MPGGDTVLSIGPSPILLWAAPVNLRKSFQGLSALVYLAGRKPEDGSYYVFVNRDSNQVKILHWDGDGLAIWAKRLEKGKFLVPTPRDGRVELDRRSLAMLLEGVSPKYLSQRFSAVLSK